MPDPQTPPHDRGDPSDPRPEHPSAHHYQAAADHLRRSAGYMDKAYRRARRGEHATAAELAKAGQGHLGEAGAHLAEARRLHAAYEAQEHGEGSHWNEPDEGED